MAQTKAQLLGPVVGDVTIDTNTLSLDAEGNKVGIGTTGATAKLHVFEPTEGDAVVQFNSGDNFPTVNRGLVIKSATGPAGYTGSKWIFDAQSSGGRIEFQTTSTPRLTILEGGNVGIGTDNPAAKLDILGALRFSRTSTYTSNVLLSITHTDSSNYGSLYFDNSNATGDYVFRTTSSSTERLRIASDGKIGINNSTPLYAMHFKNAMGSSPSFIHMEVTGSNAVGGGGGIAFDTSASNASSNNGLYLATISGVRNSADNGSNDLVFKTSKSGVAGDDGNTHSPTERLRITSDGLVGINTNNPQKTLHVNSSVDNSYGIVRISGKNRGGQLEFCTDATKTAGIYSPTSSNELVFFTSSSETERLRISSDGKIGVGGTVPGALLHLRDSQNSTQGAAQLKISKGIGSGGAPASTSRANCYIHLGSSEWGSSATGQYLIGFGYTNGETGTGIPAYIGFKETSTSGYTIGDLIFGTRDNSTGTNNATERLRIDSSGCVRVGNTHSQTTSSNTKRIALGGKASIWGWASGQINGALTLADNYYWDGSNNRAIEADNAAYLSLRSGTLRFGTTNSTPSAGGVTGLTEKFRITSGGYVNIGGNYTQTDYTAQVLRIGGNTDVMQVKGNAGNSFIRFTDTNASSDYSLGADDAISNGFILYDRNASAYRVVVNGSGNVGIGTNNPSDHLEILNNNASGLTFKTTENHYAQITSDCNRTGADSHLLAIEGYWNGTPVAEIALTAGSDTTNKDDGQIIFRTSSANNLNSNERLRITSGGDMYIKGDSSNHLKNEYRGSVSVTGSNNSSFAFEIQGSSHGGGGMLYAYGTSGNVVLNCSAEILVNHSADVIIRSMSGAYTQTRIRVKSTDSRAAIYLGRSGGYGSGGTTIHWRFIPYGATYAYTTESSNTQQDHTHNTSAGTLKITGAGGPNGNINIQGSISKGSGTFTIPHPLESKKETHNLSHSFIEGPQCDLIYRGKVNLVDGASAVNIDTNSGMTEGTFVALCRDVQCFTTNETGWTAIKGSVTGNILNIIAQENTCTDTISWMVVGERKDDNIKQSSITDNDGNLIVEPLIESEYNESDYPEYSDPE